MALLSQALHLGDLLSPHRAFQGHAAHTARWPAMLSPNGSSDTCISDGVFHIPMPCLHGALPVHPKGLLHSYLPLSRHRASLSQAQLLGYLPSPHRAFQEHATHSIEWSMVLSSKGSSGTCIPEVLRHSSILLSRRSRTSA